MGDETEGQIGLITLRPMLKVSVAEALESDIDTLVMLSKASRTRAAVERILWLSAYTTRLC